MTTSHQSNAPTVATQTVKTLAEMLARGNYDEIDPDINERNFGQETLVVGVKPRLYHFGHRVSTDEVIGRMARDGFRPGTFGDLSVYKDQDKEKDKRYPIVALGSVAVIRGYHRVAYFIRNRFPRKLYLVSTILGWDGNYRFLAVLK